MSHGILEFSVSSSFSIQKVVFLYIFWRTRVCCPFLCLCRPICIFEGDGWLSWQLSGFESRHNSNSYPRNAPPKRWRLCTQLAASACKICAFLMDFKVLHPFGGRKVYFLLQISGEIKGKYQKTLMKYQVAGFRIRIDLMLIRIRIRI
jgi:hypothetical protein